MKNLKKIIQGYERETYPNGVSNAFRYIDSQDFEKLENDIRDRVFECIKNDLLSESGYSENEVREWVDKII